MSPDSNEQLTAATAAVLLVLLAIEGVTIVFLRPLLPVHLFVGMLLIPPVALKLASTGWRFARYYTGSAPYVEKGPPRLLLRLLAPVLVASTIALLATGVALLVDGRAHSGWVLPLHKASFVVWFAVTGVHVVTYVWRLPRLVLSQRQVPGWVLRATIVAVAIAAGAAVALETLPWEDRWLG